MYKKISIIAYVNVIVVILIGVLHEQIEAISTNLLFLILIVYALLNGLYIQYELQKQKRLEMNLGKEQQLSNMILSSIPSGIVIIKPGGEILFVNEAIGHILGSTETVGKNILAFETVQEIGLNLLIEEGFHGKSKTLEEIKYKSYSTGKKVVLNFGVFPFAMNNEIGKYDVMLLINDITDEMKLREKVEEQYFNMFKSFAKFIDAKDAYTGKHSHNVSLFVDLILTKLDLPVEQIHDIRVAAALHDIGKIGIKEYILNKPGKLTDAEFSEMKMHPSIGAELISGIEDFEHVAKIIRHHHERWDGNGYPARLQGDEIPLGSQIIAIADAFDAITSNRVYQEARSLDEAKGILLKEKDRQFRGQLVDYFIESMQKT